MQIAQVTLEELRDATRQVFDGINWIQDWQERGGGKYIATFSTGTAMLWGPMEIGNPNEPFFEVQATNQETYDLIAGLSNSMGSMRGVARENGLIQAFVRTSGRELIRNSSGNPVGYLPAHVICGTNPRSAFLGDEDPDTAPEMPGLE